MFLGYESSTQPVLVRHAKCQVQMYSSLISPCTVAVCTYAMFVIKLILSLALCVDLEGFEVNMFLKLLL